MAFGMEEFKASQRGQMIAHILKDPANVAAMIAVNQYSAMPPVQVVDRQLTDQNIHLSDEEKRQVGRWVREVMEENGWTTDGVSKKRVPPGGQFRTGAVYYLKGASSRTF